MKTLISIDPGQSTGLIVGTYSDDTPFELTHAFQIEGGVEGFIDFLNPEYDDMWFLGGERFKVPHDLTVLVEKFTARGAAAGPFALKTNALEPLRIEGALLAMGITPTWVSPAQQYFLPGESKAEKKKRQHAWLQENGYAIMPKDLGTKDADDARSACAHAISWLRRQKHKPTLELFREENDKLD